MTEWTAQLPEYFPRLNYQHAPVVNFDHPVMVRLHERYGAVGKQLDAIAVLHIVNDACDAVGALTDEQRDALRITITGRLNSLVGYDFEGTSKNNHNALVDQAGLLPAIRDEFRALGVNPLAGKKAAFIGIFPNFINDDNGGKIIEELFGECHFFHENNHLTLEKSLGEPLAHRFDFVMSINLLNEPRITSSAADDVYFACANMTKQGGRVFHVHSYNPPKRSIGDLAYSDFAGQELYVVAPVTQGGPNAQYCREPHIARATIFDQTQAVRITKEHTSWFIHNIGDGCKYINPPYDRAMKPEPHKAIHMLRMDAELVEQMGFVAKDVLSRDADLVTQVIERFDERHKGDTVATKVEEACKSIAQNLPNR